MGVTLIPTLALATTRDDIVLRRIGPAQRRVIIATSARLRRAGGRADARDPPRVADEHCFDCDARVS